MITIYGLMNVSFDCDNAIPVSYIKVNSSEKIAYLTFDDGPTKRVTPKILDILSEYDIQASFFVIGSRAEKYPELIQREYDEGHFIGNHTYSHNNSKIYSSKNSFLEEVQKTDEILAEILEIPNFSCKIFRFPNGSTSPSYHSQKEKCFNYLKEIDYSYIDWNALNNDGIKKYSHYQLMQNLKKTVEGKGSIIVLMHDSGDVNKTYDVLEDSINFLREDGYEFRTLHDFVTQ